MIKRTISLLLTVMLLAAALSFGTAVRAGGGGTAEDIEVSDLIVDSTNVQVYCNEYGNAYFR